MAKTKASLTDIYWLVAENKSVHRHLLVERKTKAFFDRRLLVERKTKASVTDILLVSRKNKCVPSDTERNNDRKTQHFRLVGSTL